MDGGSPCAADGVFKLIVRLFWGEPVAFQTPRFNLWCRVDRWDNSIPIPAWVSVGYSRCQVRGSDSKQDITTILASECQVLFPKGSDVRSPQTANTGIGDYVYVAGYAYGRLQVKGICDKGAGFPNEYRLANCVFDNFSERPSFPGHVDGLLRVNPLLLPPDGYEPLPIKDAYLVWPPTI